MRRSERMMHCRGAEGSTVEAVLAAVMVGIECKNNTQLRGRHGGQGERVLISGGIRRWTRAVVLVWWTRRVDGVKKEIGKKYENVKHI